MVLKGLTKISMAFKELTQRKKLAGEEKRQAAGALAAAGLNLDAGDGGKATPFYDSSRDRCYSMEK